MLSGHATSQFQEFIKVLTSQRSLMSQLTKLVVGVNDITYAGTKNRHIRNLTCERHVGFHHASHLQCAMI